MITQSMLDNFDTFLKQIDLDFAKSNTHVGVDGAIAAVTVAKDDEDAFVLNPITGENILCGGTEKEKITVLRLGVPIGVVNKALENSEAATTLTNHIRSSILRAFLRPPLSDVKISKSFEFVKPRAFDDNALIEIRYVGKIV